MHPTEDDEATQARAEAEAEAEMDSEARKAWSTSLLDGPSEWRSRSATIAGLLSAAAAASIAALLFGPGLDGSALRQVLTVCAASLYLAAISALLLANVFPSPSVDPRRHIDHITTRTWYYRKRPPLLLDVKEPGDFYRWAEKHATEEIRPLRTLACIGSVAGVLALGFTVTAATLPPLMDIENDNYEVELLRPQSLQAVQRACPAIEGTFFAAVETTAGITVLDIPGDSCGGRPTQVAVPQADVLLRGSD